MDLLDNIRAFIRMELPSDKLKEIISDVPNEQDCVVPLEDWIVLYEKMLNSDMVVDEFFDCFMKAYFSLTEDSGIYIFPENQSEIDGLKSGNYFIEDMNILVSWDFYDEYQGMSLKDALLEYDFVKEAYECCKANINKPFSEHIFPKSAKQKYIQFLNDALKGKSQEELDLYRRFVEELCEVDDVIALECKGYGCYGGDEAYECDWVTSRDCMLRLLNVNPSEKRKAVYANTLGYIYYYGRCNDKIPEYEKAFQMYSIGAAGGMIESMYKLADMYLGGKGVPQNSLAGENIIQWIYNHHYKDFLWGDGGKIADLALRIGSLEAEKGHDRWALFYLTQADYAIRKRMPEGHYGDQKVFRSIQEQLEKARDVPYYQADRKSISGKRPVAIDNAFSGNYIVKIQLKPLKSSLKIIAVRRPKPSKWKAKLIEVAFPEYGYYNLQDSIIEKASGNIEYTTASGDPEFYAERMEFDSETRTLSFFLLDEVVATVQADKFSFRFLKIDYNVNG
ncbi:MAG: hypothetical protein Q4B26_06050 [Eubacteriales bacterium]|nr:hypothetical protein [Eubacteriales bacterium]